MLLLGGFGNECGDDSGAFYTMAVRLAVDP